MLILPIPFVKHLFIPTSCRQTDRRQTSMEQLACRLHARARPSVCPRSELEKTSADNYSTSGTSKSHAGLLLLALPRRTRSSS